MEISSRKGASVSLGPNCGGGTPVNPDAGTTYTKNKAEKDSLTISVNDTSDLVPWGANPREGGASKRLSMVVEAHTGKR